MTEHNLNRIKTVIKEIELFEEYSKIIINSDVIEIRFKCKKTGRTNRIRKSEMEQHFKNYKKTEVQMLFKKLQSELSDIVVEVLLTITDKLKII